MSRDPLLSVEDIHDAIGRIRRYTEGLDFDTFTTNDLVFDAVLRNLEVIGEAAKNVPPTLRERYPDIEWRKLAGLRDILAHAYFGIDAEIVWDVVTTKLPGLAEQVAKLLEDGTS